MVSSSSTLVANSFCTNLQVVTCSVAPLGFQRAGVQKAKCFLQCLAWATQGHAFVGPFTQWNQQEWLIWEHYREPQYAFSLKLQRAVCVVPSLTLPSPSTRDHDLRPFVCKSRVKLGGCRLFCAGRWETAAELDLVQAQDFLQ